MSVPQSIKLTNKSGGNDKSKSPSLKVFKSGGASVFSYPLHFIDNIYTVNILTIRGRGVRDGFLVPTGKCEDFSPNTPSKIIKSKNLWK